MATKPIKCPVEETGGFTFFRGNLVLDDGKKFSPSIFLGLNDIKEELNAFSSVRTILRANKCYLLSQTNIGDEFGYVSFIAVKATFPDLTVESKKYLNWEYKGITNNMGSFMVLSGNRISSVGSIDQGWILSKPGVYSQNGGITFCNPHSDMDVKLEILIAN